MIMQLPTVHDVKKNDSNSEEPGVDKSLLEISDQALQLLATFVVAHTQSDGSVKWKRVNEMLHEHIEVMVDPKVQQVLQTCGWNAEKQKFTKNKKIRLGLFQTISIVLGSKWGALTLLDDFRSNDFNLYYRLF